MMSHASGENVLVDLEIAGEKIEPGRAGTGSATFARWVVRLSTSIFMPFPWMRPSRRKSLSSRLVRLSAVKTFGGLLEQSLRALAIECLPRDLPDRITVDVSQLNIGDSIHVRDIQLPSGVTAKVPADLTAFSVLAPVVEEETDCR